MKKDKIFNIIKKERKRQINGIELIASENFVSNEVLKASGSCLTNKYAEGYPGKRYYGGCGFVDEIENIAKDRAKLLFGVEWVNVQPHSGSQANSAVYLACLKKGDTILGFDLAHGGHLTHGSVVNFSGKIYNSTFYGVDKETGIIDYESVRNIALKENPKIIIAGASAYSRDIDWKYFREIADSVGALLLGDISHPSGLISKGLLNNPFKFCHIVTTTTHKTLRGPRGGLIMMGKDFENPFNIKNNKGELTMMSSLLDLAIFPGTQGGPLMHIIASKAIALKEALSDSFFNYQVQVQRNARVLSNELIKRGYTIISGGTDNHMVLIDLRNKMITGKEAENVLEKAGITVNKNMIPFDDKSPFITSGIRIGSSAITTRGLIEKDMVRIVELIDKVLSNSSENKLIRSVKKEVKNWMSSKPIFIN